MDFKVEELPEEDDINIKLQQVANIPFSEHDKVKIHYQVGNDDDFDYIEHDVANPFVIIVGITNYNKRTSNGWQHLSGVQQDVDKMKDLWTNKLKFNQAIDVKVLTDYDQYKNCSKTEILRFLKKECQKVVDEPSGNEQPRYDGLICIVSGHGIQDSLVAADGQFININKNFFDRFNNDNAELLANYPKIFIFDICRGDIPSKIKEKMLKIRGSELISQNVEAGYRISYATTKGKTAPSDEAGGAFIQSFYETMIYLYEKKNILHKIDFQTILRMTSEKARVRTQNWICPIHEDYTVYKLFFKCAYSQNGDDGINEKQLELSAISLERWNTINTNREESFREAQRASIEEDEEEEVKQIEQIILRIDKIRNSKQFKRLYKSYDDEIVTGAKTYGDLIIDHQHYKTFKRDFVNEIKTDGLILTHLVTKEYSHYYQQLNEELMELKRRDRHRRKAMYCFDEECREKYCTCTIL